MHIFFKYAWSLLWDRPQIRSQKKPKQIKMTEIISSIFSDHNSMKRHKEMLKSMNTLRLNNVLLKNQWIKDQINKKIRKYLKTNNNEHTTLENLWYAAKVILREKFKMLQAIPKKQEKSQVNNLTYQLKEFEKEEQTTPTVSRKEKISR